MKTPNGSRKILVTGSQGYVGTELSKSLIGLGRQVVGLDVGYFRDSKLDESSDPATISVDLRNQSNINLSEFETVIHLAALSNDPLGEVDPALTYVVNRDCAINLAKKARAQGVERFVFVSTQSIYGISDSNNELREDAKKNPITAYAKSKWEAEQEILGLASNDFIVVAVRPSTIFGWGSRIRNDIIFNNMISSGIKKGKIEVHSDGTPRRPVVHISDVIDFLILMLNCPHHIINGQAYNLGLIGGNYTVLEVAQIASKCLGGVQVFLNTENLRDQRSYVVNFEKAKRELGYLAKKDLEYGGLEILYAYAKLSEPTKIRYFEDTTRLNVLGKLIESGRLNTDLSWK